MTNTRATNISTSINTGLFRGLPCIFLKLARALLLGGGLPPLRLLSHGPRLLLAGLRHLGLATSHKLCLGGAPPLHPRDSAAAAPAQPGAVPLRLACRVVSTRSLPLSPSRRRTPPWLPGPGLVGGGGSTALVVGLG